MRNEIAALQDLRGVAVLIVVCFHTGQLFDYYSMNNGTTGVMLFFAISGFIIATIHKEDAGISCLVVFAKKRIARIYPPYIPVLLCFLAILLIAGAGSEYHRNVYNVIANILLIQNANYSIHPYAWSLVYEVYYYCTFGIIVIGLRIPVRVFCLIISSPPLFAIFGLELTTHSEFLMLFSPCNLYFAFGVAYSTLRSRVVLNHKSAWSCLFLGGIVAYPLLPQYEAIRYLLIAGLFISYTSHSHSNKFLYVIGNSSYSIYLTHALIIPVIKRIDVPHNIVLFGIVVIMCTFVGLLYHYFLEVHLVRIFGTIIRA